jgi:hypothetical protein
MIDGYPFLFGRYFWTVLGIIHRKTSESGHVSSWLLCEVALQLAGIFLDI